jgi:hypothetical protein
MGWSSDLVCDRCGFRQGDFPSYLLAAYRLPDGGVAPLPFQVSWCDKCRRFVHAEWPADELVRWADVLAERWQLASREELRARGQAECARLRAIAGGRRSPPRCLACGSVNVVGLGAWSGRLMHPGCGGRVECSLSVHRYHEYPLLLAAYSPEGEALGVKVARAEPSDSATRPGD